jgi:NACalpha-BTF3-like transcription factor
MQKTVRLATALLALGFCCGAADAKSSIEHVLLISVDGMHASDLAHYVSTYPQSALAKLAGHGLTYSNAQTTLPSDSFPGLLSLVTGGSPRTTGVWYDEAFGRDLAEAKDCKPGANGVGAGYDYSETIDVRNGSMFTTIDPARLVVDPATCKPIYPHSLLRVNTVFEVVKEAGRRTAWADKHPAYDLVNGPSGKGVDDLFVPEITIPDGEDATESVEKTIAYDTLKVEAIVNELKGQDSAGKQTVGVPAVLGMNFQAVSVAQKLKGAGYKNADGEPSDGLAKALDFVDKSLATFEATLESEKIADNTLVIVTAKHGQTPIDPAKRHIVDGKALKAALASAGKDVVASVTTDDVALVWLNDNSKAGEVVQALEAKKADLAIADVISGEALAENYADPAKDPRAPDIIVLPEVGVIYTKPTATKLAEHGGGAPDDRHVALLVSNPSIKAAQVDEAVSTTQVAPSIVKALGLKPESLEAVGEEKTAVLPKLDDALGAK